MKNNTMSYYAILNEDRSPGVAKKIKNTVEAANELGFTSVFKIFPISNKFVFFKELLKDNSKFIYVRHSGWVSVFLFLILIVKRIQGAILIIDVPTPRKTALKEIEESESFFIRKIISKALLVLSGSWVFWPAHRVIQYADESLWFSFGLKYKTLKIGNGINIDSKTPLIQNKQRTGFLNIIAVAQLAGWHGYDRLINAVAFIKKINPDFEVSVKIIGEGNALPSLQRLVKEHGLEDVVMFTGFLYGDELNTAFEGMSIAVSSLALYRKGLNEASDLKTREYLARGLCVIGVGKDPDFSDNSPYRFVVPNNDNIEELVNVLYKLKSMNLPEPEEVRRYAENYLSLKVKINKILDY